MPEYFGLKRFSYYRLRTEGHNTLLIDGQNQDPMARGEMVAFGSTPDRAVAVADLSAGYKASAERVLRGVAMLDRRHVLVQDEVALKARADIVWTMHTRAKIDVAGDVATLTLGQSHLQARILEPAGARFEVGSARRAQPENSNKGVRKLLVRVKGEVGDTRVAVLLTPYRGAGPAVHKGAIVPLWQWTGRDGNPAGGAK